MEPARQRLAEWSNYNSPMKRIADHLTNHLTNTLAALIVQKQPKDVWDYVMKKASGALGGKNGCLEDNQVFGFVSDFLVLPATQTQVKAEPVKARPAPPECTATKVPQPTTTALPAKSVLTTTSHVDPFKFVVKAKQFPLTNETTTPLSKQASPSGQLALL